MKYLKYVGALLFAFIVYTFLYLPILVTILFSFNESKVQVLPIKKLTFDWYRGCSRIRSSGLPRKTV